MRTSVFSLTWLANRGTFVQILRLGPDPPKRSKCLPEKATNQVTDLLARWRKGDQAALDSLMPLVYELRRVSLLSKVYKIEQSLRIPRGTIPNAETSEGGHG